MRRESISVLYVILIAASVLPLKAQTDLTNEYRLTLSPHHNIRGALTGFGRLGYFRNPQAEYQKIYLGLPGLTYKPRQWLQLWAGGVYIYTDNFQSADKLELRPFGGVKLFVPNKRKMNLYNYTRYEYRKIEDRATHEWSTIHRLRLRSGVEIPLTSPDKAWKPKTFYLIADAEPFFQSGKKSLEQLRLRGGLAYIPNDRFRYEFIYQAQFGRPATDGQLAYNENILGLNIKIAVSKGILERALDPGID